MKNNRFFLFLIGITAFFSLTSCAEQSGSPTTSFSSLSHEHTFSDAWEYDETYHWNASTCGHDVVLNKEKHTFKETVTPPTAENEGYTTYKCTRCNYSYIGDKTAAQSPSYTLSENGAYYAVDGVGTCIDKVDIKSTYNDKPVKEILNDAFKNCDSLQSVTIPDSVTSIGAGAFSGCSSLESITIPDSVTSIGGWAFEWCTSLTSISIPNGVTSIGYFTFNGCSSLESITIPDSVTSIDIYAFSSCSSLESVTIPDSVTSIGDCAFEWCTSLTSISIPDSVTTIGGRAFFVCSSLVSITLPNSIISIGQEAFFNCQNLASVFYKGVESEWSTIDIKSNNNKLISATRYFYSENTPDGQGNYWHYVDGVPTVW